MAAVERRGEGADRGREPGDRDGDLGNGTSARSAATAAVRLAAPGAAGAPRAAGGGAVVRTGGRRDGYAAADSAVAPMIEVALGGALVRVQRSRARPMRPITLNRKNSLFAGPDQGVVQWGPIASLIETCKCKLNVVDPQVRPTSTTPSAASTATASQIDPLMPWPTSGPWETSAYDANGPTRLLFSTRRSPRVQADALAQPVEPPWYVTIGPGGGQGAPSRGSLPARSLRMTTGMWPRLLDRPKKRSMVAPPQPGSPGNVRSVCRRRPLYAVSKISDCSGNLAKPRFNRIRHRRRARGPLSCTRYCSDRNRTSWEEF